MKISSDFTNDRGVPFLAVRIESGEPYGNIVRRFPDGSHADYSKRLIAKQPMIEFYDRRYQHTELGQFVTRYFATTLAASDDTHKLHGLCLDGGIPDWQVSGENMRLVYSELITNADRAAAVVAAKRGDWWV